MKQKLKWCGYATLAGVLAGIAASIFLILLKLATEYRIAHSNLVYGLPLAGLVIGLIDHHFGRDIQPGTGLILDEIKTPRQVIPLKMAPTILFSTLLTHLFGGSAGREGTVVQMGASLSDQLSRIFPISSEERKILLVAGAGAGFGAALGAPWAGIFFGMEVMSSRFLKAFAVLECAFSSFVAYSVTRLLHAPHSQFPPLRFSFSLSSVFWVFIASGFFALIVRLFLGSEHLLERLFQKFISYPPLKPVLGGILLVLLFKGFHWEAFEGLGLNMLFRSFHETLPASTFALKLFLTALTLASGFKGGEFIPLIFMGATAGSFLSGFSQWDGPLLPSLGCVAVFAAASKTPVTCSVMAVELFGWEIAPYAILTCLMSSALSGRKSIYRKHSS